MNLYLIGLYIAGIAVGWQLPKCIGYIKTYLKNRPKRKPGRYKTAFNAFWSIVKQKPHVFCNDEVRSVIGDGREISYFQANVTDLYKQSVETQVWMKNVEKILKGEDNGQSK